MAAPGRRSGNQMSRQLCQRFGRAQHISQDRTVERAAESIAADQHQIPSRQPEEADDRWLALGETEAPLLTLPGDATLVGGQLLQLVGCLAVHPTVPGMCHAEPIAQNECHGQRHPADRFGT